MQKQYKVCVIDEAASRQDCVEIQVSGLSMEALVTLIAGMLSSLARIFQGHVTK